MHGRGVADLLDDVIADLPEVSRAASAGVDRRWPWSASPMSAKSSLMNRLVSGIVLHNIGKCQ